MGTTEQEVQGQAQDRQDLEPTPTQQAVLARKEELEAVRAAIMEGKVPEAVDPQAIHRDIAQRILEAPSIEQALALQGNTPGSDRHFVPLLIRGVQWNRSNKQGGPPVYAIMDAVNIYSGEEERINTGSVNAMTTLLRAALRGEFPFRAQLEPTREPTAQGFYPEWLRPVPEQYQEVAGAEE